MENCPRSPTSFMATRKEALLHSLRQCIGKRLRRSRLLHLTKNTSKGSIFRLNLSRPWHWQSPQAQNGSEVPRNASRATPPAHPGRYHPVTLAANGILEVRRVHARPGTPARSLSASKFKAKTHDFNMISIRCSFISDVKSDILPLEKACRAGL